MVLGTGRLVSGYNNKRGGHQDLNHDCWSLHDHGPKVMKDIFLVK